MAELTVIAVDWSGAKKTNLRSGIWVTAIRDGRIVYSEPARRREEAVAYVRECSSPLVAGFDFSFGVPAWFARHHKCDAIADVWTLMASEGDVWIGTPAVTPFWRDRGCAPPPEQRFRACEAALRVRGSQPKSIFQLVGVGMVGPGSVRGMPHLAHLRTTGFNIWPFEAAGDRMAIEIYPSLLRKIAPHHDLGPSDEHRRDAEASARVMWEHRDGFADLSAATDPVTMLEGDVWMPGKT